MGSGLKQIEKIIHTLGNNTLPHAELIDKCNRQSNIPPGTIRSSMHRNQKYFIKTADGYKLSDEGRGELNRIYDYVGTTAKEQYGELVERPYIKKCLKDLLNGKSTAVHIPYTHIEKFNPELGDDLIHTPGIVLEEIEQGIKQIHPEVDTVIVRITALPTTMEPHQIRAEHTGQLLQVSGRVTVQQNNIQPRIMVAAFLCMRCNQITNVVQDSIGKLQEPHTCDNEFCHQKGPFKQDFENCEYTNGQMITIEPQEGRASLKIALTEDLCEAPWIRDSRQIHAVGILKQRLVTTKNGKSTDTEPYLEAISVTMTDNIDIDVTPADVKIFKEWIKEPAILQDRIARSIAPHVYGMDSIKRAMALSLFSDWSWDANWMEDRPRSSIHGLIIGDPALAKTQVLRDWALKVAPGGIFLSGESATAAGLSNAAVQEDGVWVIRSGAFGAADRKVFAYDELDKMDKDDFKILVSGLETQSITTAKAGIRATFNTRTAVWSGANPVSGNIDRDVDIFAQVGFKSWLSSRYDFTFVEIDPRDDAHDELVGIAIGKHIDGDIDEVSRDIDIDMLRKYIVYARTHPEQKLDDETQMALRDAFRDIRHDPQYTQIQESITYRVQASLDRIAKAVARQVCAEKVTIDHVEYAVDLYKKSLKSLLIKDQQDYEPGNVVIGDQPVSRGHMIRTVHKAIINGAKTVREINERYPDFTRKEIGAAIHDLHNRGSIMKPAGYGGYKSI